MTEYITPAIIMTIIAVCFFKRVPIYTAAVEGAEEGMKTAVKILPSMAMILAAVGMLKSSGVLSLFINFLSPVTSFFNIPPEAMPMIILRPVSGSGALGILGDIFSTCGPDSRAGLISSVIMGSTETTFYTLAVYFGAAGIKSPAKVIPCALMGDLAGVIAALIIF